LFTKKFEKIALIILSTIFFSATLIAIYHFAIEQGIIKESLVCNLNNENNNLSKEALLSQLREMPVSCKEVSFKILGLSLATFNIFISFVLGVTTTKLLLIYEKK
jgi:disulfide bond formation protein DsbB